MSTRLSNTKLNVYNTCPRKYKLYYVDNIRETTISSALLFGKAIDFALNDLIYSKNLDAAKDIFDFNFKFTMLHGENINVEETKLVQYNDSDLDEELLIHYKCTKENKFFWSLYYKGQVILESYNKFVLPRIKKVIACQERIEYKNDIGDVLEGNLDLIVEWSDGKTYLLDHKTSSSKYEKDSAGKSQQLVLYNYILNNKYSLDGVGYIVLNKAIWKKKTKICSQCKYVGTGERHSNCSNLVDGKRCKGEWIINLNPTCFIDIILNQVNTKVEDLMLDSFDGVNYNIKNENFPPNLSSCKRGKFVCPYLDLCVNGKMTNLIKLNK